MNRLRNLALVVLLNSIQVAFSHALLVDSVPAAGQAISGDTLQLELVFTEPMEIDFSVFELYPLQDGDTELSLDNESHWMGYLQNSDLSDTLLEIDATSDAQNVQISWPNSLDPGEYVLVWRVLSIDTHVSNGWLRFNVTTE